METSPMGVAMMPGKWLVSVRKDSNEQLEVIDVCGDKCAEDFDKKYGLAGTTIHDIDETGEEVVRTTEHGTPPLEN